MVWGVSEAFEASYGRKIEKMSIFEVFLQGKITIRPSDEPETSVNQLYIDFGGLSMGRILFYTYLNR